MIKQKIIKNLGVVLGLFMILSSCSTQEGAIENEDIRSRKIKVNDLPVLLKKNIQARKQSGIHHRGGVNYLAYINYDNVIEITQNNGNKTYTFGLNLIESQTLTNIVITQTANTFEYGLVVYSSSNLQQWKEDIANLRRSDIIVDVRLENLESVSYRNKSGSYINETTSDDCVEVGYICPSFIHTLTSGGTCIHDGATWMTFLFKVPCDPVTPGGGGSSSPPNPTNPGTGTNPGDDPYTLPLVPDPNVNAVVDFAITLPGMSDLDLDTQTQIMQYLLENTKNNVIKPAAKTFIENLVDEIATSIGENSDDGWNPDVILFEETLNSPVITDIEDYLSPFDTSKPAAFTLFIDQPTPNSKTAWSGSLDDPEVGHTFISIKQGNVRRVLGFYPKTGVSLTNPSKTSVLKNDSGHSYDVTISLTVGPQKLSAILAYIKSAPTTYNLNSYNCTDFGMQVSLLAGLNMASAYGTWLGGGGDNPGQLGQNVRNMPVPAGALKTTTGGNSPSNTD